MKNSHQKLGYLISENNVYDLLQKTTLIGRSPSCHLVIKVFFSFNLFDLF